jgi:hypothetical protein
MRSTPPVDEEPRVGRSACQVLALEADALEFERAVKVQACPAGDLHAIAAPIPVAFSSLQTRSRSGELHQKESRA